MQQTSLIGFESPGEAPGACLFSVVVPPLDGELLYAFGDGNGTASHLVIGGMIEVPLGSRRTTGFIVSVNSEREEKASKEMRAKGIKIRAVSGESTIIPSIPASQLPLFEWMARYYCEPLSRILDLAVPRAAESREDLWYSLTAPSELPKLGERQLAIIEYLRAHGPRAPASVLRRECGASASVLKTLVKRQFLQLEEEAQPTPFSLATEIPTPSALTDAQRACADAAIEDVLNDRNASYLLHGVTGSGKTEVYLEVIIEALRRGKSALIVVPEIALTPQLLHRFQARLGCSVAVLHSSLKPSERWEHWTDLLNGRVRVAIGARSAIFAPLQNLGVIIVDEEHDSSFKQGEGIRYNARDLALVRAKQASCPVILGSATPSLETYNHARAGRHRLFTLESRFYNAPRLHYTIVDLNRVKPWEMPSKSIAPEFLERLKRVLQAGDQAFILYNRRGFASYLQCDACEYVVGCPHCSVTLTYHRNPSSLLCHFCGYSSPPLVVCPTCGKSQRETPAGIIDSAFVERGAGTERVFEELQELLPSARIAKLDRDAVQTLDDYTKILERVRSKDVEILVGTQMIAKGHDLPDVTYVGVVDCDVGLHMPDFRAGERVYQLLTQVAGRAGRRDKQGYVVLQTRVPQHPSLVMTMRSDYHGFADSELATREGLGYPPFQRLLRILISAQDRSLAATIAVQLAAFAREVAQGSAAVVLGPSPAPIERTRDYWRQHILLKSGSAATLQQLLWKLKNGFRAPTAARVMYDVDPQDML